MENDININCRVFSYSYSFFDGDCIVFFNCRITRDIPELGLVLGKEFEKITFSIKEKSFNFVTDYYQESEEEGWQEGHGSVSISQEILAPYLRQTIYFFQININGEWEKLHLSPSIVEKSQKESILEALEKSGIKCRACLFDVATGMPCSEQYPYGEVTDGWERDLLMHCKSQIEKLRLEKRV